MTDIHLDISSRLRNLEKDEGHNPLATISFPGGVIDTTANWRRRLQNAVGNEKDASRIADTLTGCEALAWFIDRFATYGAGRSVPAKLLLHQLLDVIHELCDLRNGKKRKKFKQSVKKALGKNALQERLWTLWDKDRHRSHLSGTRNERDHGYDYFEQIGEAWICVIQVVAKLDGDFSDYSGLLGKLTDREKKRKAAKKSESLF